MLRIKDVPALHANHSPIGSMAPQTRRVEVTWQEGLRSRAAVSSFVYQVNERDAEKIRWYLEDFAEFRAQPAPLLAADAEARLADIGADLFSSVFSEQDAAGIWADAASELGQVRVEVNTNLAEVSELPWELLRDPATGVHTALGAAAFVRTPLEHTDQTRMPQTPGNRLRVLLVICRPGGGEDVPFRSVASRLVRGGAGRMDGLDLDVLRPATFRRLSEVLHAAADAGRQYHVVHFDGHGTYLDVTQPGGLGPDKGSPAGISGANISAAGALREGQHGYLLFEDPSSPANQQLVGGPLLGHLLATTGVPVLVLNACRSAYAETPDRPAVLPSDNEGERPSDTTTDSEDNLAAWPLLDAHARIRAYGSLAAEVASMGVPGVVAMRYNVYVATAAQFVADLYAHLLAGRPLGEAATAARCALAADPTRHIGVGPVVLQDWAVPVIYEAAPLQLVAPDAREAPLIKLAPADTVDPGRTVRNMPRPPDAGFFGRDKALLALDRAFDTHPVVLLHAFAGAGKSSTAAEFARWYQATGGLDSPAHPEGGPGPMLWSSFEHYLPLERLLNAVGDHFSRLLEASSIHFAAITSPGQRRSLILEILAQIPTLWVWDNIEPVTGFPARAPSEWSKHQQEELADFLRDLAQRTRCKVLLTSRRDESAWLGNLPARIQLASMPMRERQQLAAAIATRQGHLAAEADWRPLLRYTGGNPLTITVLVSQAVHENLTTDNDIKGLVGRLRSGETALESDSDAALGRTRSLAASLSYGFAHAFTNTERGVLALLHLFRDTVDVDAFCFMGDPEVAGADAVRQLFGLTREVGIALLDRAADIGLLTTLHNGYYAIHPALPWYLANLFTTTYGASGDLEATRAAMAYTHAYAYLGRYYLGEYEDGRTEPVIAALSIEETNFRQALVPMPGI